MSDPLERAIAAAKEEGRREAIEEAAKVAEREAFGAEPEVRTAYDIAAAIRALKGDHAPTKPQEVK